MIYLKILLFPILNRLSLYDEEGTWAFMWYCAWHADIKRHKRRHRDARYNAKRRARKASEDVARSA